MSIGDVWYETSPYLYAPLGTVVLFGSDGSLAKVSGALLVIAAATILRMRWSYRQRRKLALARAARRAIPQGIPHIHLTTPSGARGSAGRSPPASARNK